MYVAKFLNPLLAGPHVEIFVDGEESVTTVRRSQFRQSAITRTGDKVQVMSTVGAVQSGGHENYGTGVCGTRPCKKRKSGAPHIPEWERNQGLKGWATRRDMN